MRLLWGAVASYHFSFVVTTLTPSLTTLRVCHFRGGAHGNDRSEGSADIPHAIKDAIYSEQITRHCTVIGKHMVWQRANHLVLPPLGLLRRGMGRLSVGLYPVSP